MWRVGSRRGPTGTAMRWSFGRRIAMLALGASSLASAALPGIDARAAPAEPPTPALRVVALAPALAELVDQAGGGDRLVGISTATGGLARAGRVAIVASPGRIDLERLVSLEPDLVLYWPSGNPLAALERLRRLHIPTLGYEPHRLSDVAGFVRTLGDVLDTREAAAASAGRFERELAVLPVARGEPSVFIAVSQEPLYTVGGHHLVSDVVRRCGGRNVFDDLPVPAATVSAETLYARRPDFILAAATPDRRSVVRAEWNRYALLPAVSEGRVAVVDSRALYDQSLDVADAVRAVCRALVEAFGER